MKKLILVLVIIGLTGCFKQEEKILITDTNQKIELIERIIQKEDKEAEIKYNEITKKLKEQAENGSQIAYKEYEEWIGKYSAKKNRGKIPEKQKFGQETF